MITLRRSSLASISAVLTSFMVTSAQLGSAQAPRPSGPPVQEPGKLDTAIKIPQFEIISVKPSKDNGTRIQFTPGGMTGTAVATQFLLFESFGGLNESRVIGAPSWTATEGFDMAAKVSDADLPAFAKLTFEQRRTMLQQILVERFKLVVHHETRELPIYQLIIGRNGQKLKEAAPISPASDPPRFKGIMFGRSKVTATDASMSMFITPLSRQLGRVVVDKTGLAGKYDFTLEWTPEGAVPAGGSALGAPPPEQSGPDIFTAIQEQLGLKLESAKGPVDVIVIDHIEKPSAN